MSTAVASSPLASTTGSALLSSMTGVALLSSMTGFSRASNARGLTWELRSVNGKGLDVRLRLPSGWDALELAARDLISRRLSRGSINAVLSLGPEAQGPAGININRPLLDHLMILAADLPQHIAPPTFDGLLAIRGVLVAAEEIVPDAETKAAREADALDLLNEAMIALVNARQQEGQRLAAVMGEQLSGIEILVQRAAGRVAERGETARDRLRGLVAELVGSGVPIAEERLAQELALLVIKQDIREELDRLRAHIEQARDLLAQPTASGRRLDFLCQEFNREANTLCSKAQDVELTRIGLDLKVLIDQMREQVQNLE